MQIDSLWQYVYYKLIEKELTSNLIRDLYSCTAYDYEQKVQLDDKLKFK
jgi:hypothetical protein